MTSASLVLLRTQSDARLLALARGGHERAFEAIVERYRRPLMRTCRRVLPEARAEDALQQALLAAWTAIAGGDHVRDLRPWLHRIAHRTALNQLRVSGYDFDELHDALRIAGGPEEELERRTVMRQTLAALAALPERQREALMAIAVEGRSQDEVAHDLGLTSGAVRQLVHRARSSLRAAATAITPLPLVSWAAAAATRGEPMTSRLAELTAAGGGAGTATALAKAGTVALLAGSAAAGPAVVDRAATHHHATHAQRGARAEPRPAHRRVSAPPAATVAATPVRQVAPPPRLPASPAPAPRRISYRPGAAAPDGDESGPRVRRERAEDDERGGGTREVYNRNVETDDDRPEPVQAEPTATAEPPREEISRSGEGSGSRDGEPDAEPSDDRSGEDPPDGAS